MARQQAEAAHITAGNAVDTAANAYKAARDGVAHTPDEYAPDWILVEDEPEPPEDDEEPVDPDEPGDEDDGDQDDGEADEEPTAPEWAPDQDYTAGDELTYKGAQYRVLQSHRSAAHWLPSAVPALYERMEDVP